MAIKIKLPITNQPVVEPAPNGTLQFTVPWYRFFGDLLGLAVESSGVETIVAGTGISVVSIDPANPVVSATGVQSVVAGTNVTVNNTDPQNPIVSASGGVQSVVAGDGITVDNTDPANPIVASQGAVPVFSYLAAANTDSAQFLLNISGLTIQTLGLQTFPVKSFATYLGSLDKALVTTNASADSSASQFNSQVGMSVQRAITAGNGGGFRMSFMFAGVTTLAAQRFFCGAVPRNTDPCLTTEPSAKVNILGVGLDSTDTNLQLMRNDGSGTATKIDLGISWVSIAGKVMRLQIYVPRGGARADVTLIDVQAGTSMTNSVTTNLPDVDVNLNPHCGINTAALTTALSLAVVELGFVKIV